MTSRGTHGSSDVTVHTRRTERDNKPQLIKDLMDDFNVEKMSPGLKRGMVLSIYKAKIREVLNTIKFMGDLKGASLKPSGPDSYTLYIYFNPGSLWRVELQQNRHRLKELLNKRLKSEFINQIYIY